MIKKNQHVVPLGNGWAVKSAGAQRVTIITAKQADAISVGRCYAIKYHSELIIHGKNGKIRERNSYGNDPNPPRG